MPNKYYPRSTTAKTTSNNICHGPGDKWVLSALGVGELVLRVA